MLPTLRALVLLENPCSDEAEYRLESLVLLPNLERLDKDFFEEEERNEAADIRQRRKEEELELQKEREREKELEVRQGKIFFFMIRGIQNIKDPALLSFVTIALDAFLLSLQWYHIWIIIKSGHRENML